MIAARPTLDAIRAEFPALQSSTVFFENAGGSQVPRSVADAVRDYMLESYVNYGAPYPESESAGETVRQAHALVNLMMNGIGLGEVILGASTSQLCRMLADCYLEVLQPGDRVVVAASGHEANIGPWMRLAQFGIDVQLWPLDRDAEACTLEDLLPLLNPRTKIVAFPHVSNLTGHVMDVAAVAEVAHAAGAEIVVDGVAYAPHSAIDVAAWKADWYVYSTYKVYGPHMGALFGTHEALGKLTGPSHFFIPRDAWPTKFELGAISHEGCAAILGLAPYLRFLAGSETLSRADVRTAFETMEHYERQATRRMIDFLVADSRYRVVGPKSSGSERVGTIGFLHRDRSPAEIADRAGAAGIGMRSGHMYSYRLCEGLGIDPATGVARVSFAHYNTVDEVDRLIAVLETL
ncbi:MAG: aminotransferase class V-fold PLP-dependent enzyme [Fimbriimonadaceae bacterium]